MCDWLDHLCIPPLEENICLSSTNKIMSYTKDVLTQPHVSLVQLSCVTKLSQVYWVMPSSHLQQIMLGALCGMISAPFVTTTQLFFCVIFKPISNGLMQSNSYKVFLVSNQIKTNLKKGLGCFSISACFTSLVQHLFIFICRLGASHGCCFILTKV